MFVNKSYYDNLLKAINKIKNTVAAKMQTHFCMALHFFMIKMIGVLR